MRGSRARILLIEDNRADVYLIQEAIRCAGIDGDLQVLSDGEKAMQALTLLERDPSLPCPNLVILDINLPKRPGNEVLQHMRRGVRCSGIQVLVVTSSDSGRDREEMRRLGVRAYFRKPSEFAAFMELGGIVKGLLSKCGTPAP